MSRVAGIYRNTVWFRGGFARYRGGIAVGIAVVSRVLRGFAGFVSRGPRYRGSYFTVHTGYMRSPALPLGPGPTGTGNRARDFWARTSPRVG